MSDSRTAEPPELRQVDPELRTIAMAMRAVTASYVPMSLEKLAVRRAAIAALPVAPPTDVPVEERVIPGDDDGEDVTIFIVNARPGAARPGLARPGLTRPGLTRPGILHLHGGGFNAGSARSGMSQIQELATALDCVVVTVEYRLAPETPFPGALADSHAALRWMHANAAALGVDPARIALLGESAGGGHAALLALAARDRGTGPICLLALIYPMLDDRTGSSRAVPGHIGTFGWNAEVNRFGWQCFLGRPPGGDDVPEDAVPARARSLAGLPPTFIGVGTLDLFVAENLAFAGRLIDAGVPTELVVVPGAIHGFDMLARDCDISQRFIATKLAALRRAFAG